LVASYDLQPGNGMRLFLRKQVSKEASKKTIYIAPELTNELGSITVPEPYWQRKANINAAMPLLGHH